MAQLKDTTVDGILTVNNGTGAIDVQSKINDIEIHELNHSVLYYKIIVADLKNCEFINGYCTVDLSSYLEKHNITRFADNVIAMNTQPKSAYVLNSAFVDRNNNVLQMNARRVSDGAEVTTNFKVTAILFGVKE